MYGHRPSFFVNADSKELKILCFAIPLEVLILKDLAKTGLLGLFQS